MTALANHRPSRPTIHLSGVPRDAVETTFNGGRPTRWNAAPQLRDGRAGAEVRRFDRGRRPVTFVRLGSRRRGRSAAMRRTALNVSLTASGDEKARAMSSSRSTRFVPSRYCLTCFPRTPPLIEEKSYSGRRSSVRDRLAFFMEPPHSPARFCNRLQPRFPVPWATATVSDGYDVNDPVRLTIDDREWKPMEGIAACPCAILGPSMRCLEYP